MHESASLLPRASSVVTGSVTTDELGLVAGAAVLLVALVLIKIKRDHDQRIRKAASVGYYDPDVARYGHRSVPPPPSDLNGDPLPLAPSFAAPGRARARMNRGVEAAPSRPTLSSSFDTSTAVPPRPVPAFDPIEAINARPTATGGRAPTAPPSAAPGLPTLEQPPPPTGVPTDSAASSGRPGR